jgi:outer membrane lipase/esterase
MMKSMGNWAGRVFAGVGAGLCVLLASCGGGTERVEEFEPTRYIVFGDEMSVLTKDAPQGRKYSVNALDSDGIGINCAANSSSQPSLLWTQELADEFGFVFEECNPSARAVTAFSYAAPGAKAADFLTQLAAARVVHGPFGCNDLMSVLIGANDVFEMFETVYLADPTPSTATAITNELTRRGALLGKAIAALTDNDGPNVVVSTIPLVNLTPWARQFNIDRPGIDAPGVLRQFSDAFNTALRVNIPNDGSRWALVELDALLQAGFNNPENYGLNNVNDAVCSPLTWNTANCTTATLVTNGNPNTWLWASNKWIGWLAHDRLGSFARNRAEGNPFGCN